MEPPQLQELEQSSPTDLGARRRARRMLRRAGICGLEWQGLILTLMVRSRSESWLRRALRRPLAGHLKMVWSCQTES